METINLLGEFLICLGVAIVLFSLILIIWVLPFIGHGESSVEKTLVITIILVILSFSAGFICIDYSKDSKTLIKIESSSDLYYDKETHIIYYVTDKITTPLYNTDGSFKTYTED